MRITKQALPLAALALLILTLFWAHRSRPLGVLAANNLQSGDEAPLWQRSDAVLPPGASLQELSPPGDPAARDAAQPDLPPAASEGGILRDFRLAGSVFRPLSSDAGYERSGGGGCTYSTAGADGLWNAPLTLPQGATINTVRMYYDDTSTTFNATGWFSIYDLYGELVEEWIMTSSGDGGEGFADTFPVIDHVVDYAIYAYTLNWRPLQEGVTMQLCGFRVFYEPPPLGVSFMPIAASE